MIPTLTRRSLGAAMLGAATCRALPALAQARDDFAALEARSGGRLGGVALDTGSGHRIEYRAAERFAMCSTHKFLTTAAVLNLVDRGRITRDRHVPYSHADLLEYAPITRKNVGTGFMTVGDLCAAAVEWSDNTAADLLLGLIDGPAGWTRYARSIGDNVSRLDRTEPTLNTAIPGDPRDTTTPEAMLRNLDTVLLGKALSPVSRQSLEHWMLASRITGTLLHAGLPKGWRVGDKSGSGDHGTRNDIGIILRPKGAPILASVFYTTSTLPPASQDKVLAETGRIIARAFGA